VHAHYRPRPPRAPAHAAAVTLTPTQTRRQKVVEDKEYFSGSLVETQRSAAADDACQDLAVLRRSSSYNADRYPKKKTLRFQTSMRAHVQAPKPKQ
jgi:hypothetical protein